MEEESDGELVFLVTLLKWNDGKISVLVYKKPTHTDQYLHYSSHHHTNCKESVVSSLFNKAYSIITNKDDLYKENARIKQVWKCCNRSLNTKINRLHERCLQIVYNDKKSNFNELLVKALSLSIIKIYKN